MRGFDVNSIFNNRDAGSLRMLMSLLYHLPNFCKLFFRLLKDLRVASWKKLIFIVAVVYAVSPWDVFPDVFFPPFGYVDDVVILFVAVRWFVGACPRQVVAEHVRAIAEEDAQTNTKS